MNTKTVPALVVLLLALSASIALGAEPQTFQDWATAPSSDGSYVTALTVNLSGDYLGEFCYLDKHCEWRITIKGFQCGQNVQSVEMINGANGAAPLKSHALELWQVPTYGPRALMTGASLSTSSTATPKLAS